MENYNLTEEEKRKAKNEYMKKWRKENKLTEEQKQAKKDYNKKWKEDNKDYNKIWKRNNKKELSEEEKETLKEYMKEWRKNNKKELTEEEKQKNRKYCKEYHQKNQKKILERKKITDKIYYDNNRETILDKKKIYQSNCRERINSYMRNYHKNRCENDELYKLSHNTKSLISRSIKSNGYQKESKTFEILGCSFETFKEHLESQFLSWMNWKNYGNPKDGLIEPNKTWDIDHIIPLASATNKEELLKLNHYTNLQPLCSYENRFIKRNNIIEVNA